VLQRRDRTGSEDLFIGSATPRAAERPSGHGVRKRVERCRLGHRRNGNRGVFITLWPNGELLGVLLGVRYKNWPSDAVDPMPFKPVLNAMPRSAPLALARKTAPELFTL
jgi:hypothetical protein